MRTTVDLDPALLKRLRIAARRRGVTVKELLAQLLERGLDEQAATGARRARFRTPTFAMGRPYADLTKALDVAAELDDEETLRKLSLRK